ncbi:MAG: urease accessory protein UreE [Gammaproteobacteria bacterium]|nr:urease accessory protein UreE [Gammaproteobacteria bacterium]
MIELTQILTDKDSDYETTLSLPIDQRGKSRLKVKLDDGRDAGLFLERGNLLRDGDRLSNEQGVVVKVVAAAECVSTVHSDDLTLLARATYHLGNRHVPVQIESGWIRYLHDHVLDAMLEQMGLCVEVSHAAFEPEAGAYQQMTGGAHHHGHGHAQH